MSDTKKILNEIFRNPEQELLMFNNISRLNIYEKTPGKYYIKSISRLEEEKLVYNTATKKAAPEEIVRQLFLDQLVRNYGYPKNLIEVEKKVNFGREIKRADIVVFRNDEITPKIIIEVKAPNVENDIQQLKSYLNAEGAPVGLALNGKTRLILYRPYPRDFDDTLDDIPAFDEEVEDVLKKKKTLKDLKVVDLQATIKALEELVLANSGHDSFDEIFKLIYAKLFDEREALNRENQELNFRKSPTGKPEETKKKIDELFDHAKSEWPDIFERTEKIKLSATHLSVCVGELQDIQLFGSNLRIIDEAFEYLLPDVAKGKKGQYFTPRIVIDMCVKMLQPKNREFVIDTACGSAGFLVHTMQHVWESMNNEKSKSDYSSKYLYGVDFDEKSTKISKAIMLIAGDGKSHIYKTNSLDSSEWNEKLKSDFRENGLVTEFEDFRASEENQGSYRYLNFDVLLANPPFAGEIKEKHLLAQYELGRNSNGKMQNKVERHLLFIERNLNMVRPGGRLAMVLPQGVFNNPTQDHVREFILSKARILAVVGLHSNSFKPHTPTKTSVVFLQKWDKEPESERLNYPIFFATQKLTFKDNSGNYINAIDEDGKLQKDSSGNTIFQSDLDEIASKFLEWGMSEGLSFLNEQ